MDTVLPKSEHGLSELLDAELRSSVSAASMAMTAALKSRYGDAVLGIVYYGSCFRTGTEKDGILDIFIIVDDYRKVYRKTTLALANKLLPPNVFYYELDFAGSTLRTKYAIITLDQFSKRCSSRCFHTFFWARFAQPCALTYVQNDNVRASLVASLKQAIETFVTRVMPFLPPRFDAETLWRDGLSASYRTELRPESPGASARLVESNASRYRAVTTMVLAAHRDVELLGGDAYAAEFLATISPRQRWLARQTWRLRGPQGKLINLLRIMKAALF